MSMTEENIGIGEDSDASPNRTERSSFKSRTSPIGGRFVRPRARSCWFSHESGDSESGIGFDGNITFPSIVNRVDVLDRLTCGTLMPEVLAGMRQSHTLVDASENMDLSSTFNSTILAEFIPDVASYVNVKNFMNSGAFRCRIRGSSPSFDKLARSLTGVSRRRPIPRSVSFDDFFVRDAELIEKKDKLANTRPPKARRCLSPGSERVLRRKAKRVEDTSASVERCAIAVPVDSQRGTEECAKRASLNEFFRRDAQSRLNREALEDAPPEKTPVYCSPVSDKLVARKKARDISSQRKSELTQSEATTPSPRVRKSLDPSRSCGTKTKERSIYRDTRRVAETPRSTKTELMRRSADYAGTSADATPKQRRVKPGKVPAYMTLVSNLLKKQPILTRTKRTKC